MNIVANNITKAVLLLAVTFAIAPIFTAALTARGKYDVRHSELQQYQPASEASEDDR